MNIRILGLNVGILETRMKNLRVLNEIFHRKSVNIKFGQLRLITKTSEFLDNKINQKYSITIFHNVNNEISKIFQVFKYDGFGLNIY